MRVTIGIPFFNSAATLRQAVQSVLAQTHGDWELLLVDDGSTDGSAALARSFTDSRIRVRGGGANRGLAARLNEIAREARGEYLARMDADDLMHPDRLARQVEYLDRNPGVDVCSTAAYVIDARGAITGWRAALGAAWPDGVEPRLALADTPVLHPTVCGRTAWFRANPYDGRFDRAEDHELWVRAAGFTRFGFLAEALHFYREDGALGLSKYLRSGRTDRRIFERYGPAVAGRAATLHLIARSHAKCLAYRILAATGRTGVWVRRRTKPLSAETRAEAMAALQAIEVFGMAEAIA